MTQSETPQAFEDVAQALPHLQQLVESGQFQAACEAIAPLLVEQPGHRDLLYLHAVAQRMLHRIPEALATLEALESWYPSYPRLFQERGHCHVFRRDAPAAIAAFERAVQLNPALPASWQALAGLYRMTGRDADARTAADHVATMEKLPPEIVTARSMLADGNLHEAEDVIRPFLMQNGEHVEGMRILANVARQLEFLADAEILLEGVLRKSPDYRGARYDYVVTLVDLNKYAKAREEVEKLIAAEPANPAPRITLAGILLKLGEIDDAIHRFHALISEMPGDADAVLSLGHAFKAQGNMNESVAAYRRAAAVREGFGEPWWSLANLKTYRFTDEELTTMRRLESRGAMQQADRYHLCFALGKALEDRQEFAESFTYYERGNALKKAECDHRTAVYERKAKVQRELCNEAFFAEREGWGCESAEPIFVLGMPRAGSTLIEQILASHSQIEGTMELANVPRLTSRLGGRGRPGEPGYPRVLEHLDEASCRRFGEDYIRDTQVYRSGKPFFIDKMPNNFRHIALLHLMLPNARIIDARRDPMDCCFGNYKQLYAKGHEFAYSQQDIGDYYRIYVDTMAHWDRVLPGRVLRVQHEDLFEDLEGQVRRMLDYCGLPFEQACVEFHRTERSVHTASAAQVRRPLNREGVGAWRPYSAWLGPMREALGDTLRD